MKQVCLGPLKYHLLRARESPFQCDSVLSQKISEWSQDIHLCSWQMCLAVISTPNQWARFHMTLELTKHPLRSFSLLEFQGYVISYNIARRDTKFNEINGKQNYE